jgi:hypothetical protein
MKIHSFHSLMVMIRAVRDSKIPESRESRPRPRLDPESRDRDRDSTPRLETETETQKKPRFSETRESRPRLFFYKMFYFVQKT